jgi:basic membrane protein A
MLIPLAVGVAAGCGGKSKTTKTTAAVSGSKAKVALLSQEDFKTSGYGRSVSAGIPLIQKLGNPVTTSGLITPANFATSLNDFASRGYKVILLDGIEWTDAVTRVAPKYPGVRFVIINGASSAKPNVTSYSFAWEQGGYLAGLAGGLATKTNKLGDIGGMPIPPIQGLFYGFQQGVAKVNPKANVTITYSGDFIDAAKAGQVATTQMSRGIDVIWAITDAANPGIFQAVSRTHNMVVGYGFNEANLAPNNTLTTLTVDYGRVAFTAVQAYDKGKLAPTIYTESFKDHVFGLAPLHGVSAATATKIQSLAKQAEAGKFPIKVFKG